MTNFIPIFPLNIIVYPGEFVNLHIFEPRYKELIGECLREKRPFGIPSIVNEHIGDIGTLMEVSELSKAYDNGELDIRTRGLQVFRVLEIIKHVPDKLYSGAIVNYPDNIETAGVRDQMQKLIRGVRELHRLLNIQKDFNKPDAELNSYDLAHHAGLSPEQEYELLGLLQEAQRQEYLKRHLNNVLPVIAQMETLKEKVKLNGHFRNLSALDFELPE